MSSRCVTVLVWIFVGLLFSFSISTVVADEQKVYESLEQITIGKVFFSPQQRAHLDEQRAPVPVFANTGSSGAKRRHKKARENAAGYISRSDGSSKVYANGEFVTSSNSDTVIFPGAVKVARGQDTDSTKASDEED